MRYLADAIEYFNLYAAIVNKFLMVLNMVLNIKKKQVFKHQFGYICDRNVKKPSNGFKGQTLEVLKMNYTIGILLALLCE